MTHTENMRAERTRHAEHADCAARVTVIVWDIPIRVFHWLLVAGLVAAYLTAEFHHGHLHSCIGYGLCLLLIARFLWGFVGGRYARFRSFLFSPRETLEYAKSMFRGRPRHYLGHNPAGALMVFALLAVIALILATGLLTLATIDFAGPLLPFTRHIDDAASYAIQDAHAFLGNAVWCMVALHLAGVAIGSVQHGENLVAAMMTGKKIRPPAERRGARAQPHPLPPTQ